MAEEKKLFGMPAEKGRWLLIVLGFIINICLGSVYAYSIFGKQLMTEWGISTGTSLGMFKYQIPFGVFLLFFAAIFPLSGQLLEKLGPKKQGIIGGIIVAAGWILASFVASGTESVPLFVLTYGVIGGIGVGICYIAPIQVATRWFPDKKGLATGLTVAGFGGSPFISTYLGQELIKIDNQVSDALLYLGIAFLVVLLVCFWLMSFPEAGWKPAGWTPKATTAAATSAVNYNRNEIVKTATFWFLFACFAIGSLAGLMAIGVYATIMTNTKVALGIHTTALATATIVQFILAPFNAGGRPVLGAVTDRLGPRVAAMITFVLIIAAAAGMIVVGKGTDTASTLNKVLYFVCFAAFYAGLGGWLAIAPTAVAQYFGAKFSSRNYGILFLAYGIGGIIATFVAAYSRDIFKGSTFDMFIPVAILAALGFVMAAFMMKPPKQVEAAKK
ncbi:MAG TPA: OFA family MFS transporter [Dehalococcoidia bacterium]|nr:OFA family MFS transporter [Dehalococcoidia bacterium]